MSSARIPKPLPVDVPQALEAICAYGHGRCWYCDGKLPAAERAIRAGWDVQRIDDQPVASIILVCPRCARRKARLGEHEFERRLTLVPPVHSSPSPRRPRVQPGAAGATG
ncbi:MAG TPA: hypothetical protein VKU44_08680 [Terriglobia bacterium]|nr:hypothetical protein [Terriglobia bacterium]